jgi:hypothetical protein
VCVCVCVCVVLRTTGALLLGHSMHYDSAMN